MGIVDDPYLSAISEAELEKTTAGKGSNMMVKTKTRKYELRRLKERVAVEGRATIGMMEKCRQFPWTQETMIAVGTLDNVLVTFFVEVLAPTITEEMIED